MGRPDGQEVVRLRARRSRIRETPSGYRISFRQAADGHSSIGHALQRAPPHLSNHGLGAESGLYQNTVAIAATSLRANRFRDHRARLRRLRDL